MDFVLPNIINSSFRRPFRPTLWAFASIVLKRGKNPRTRILTTVGYTSLIKPGIFWVDYLGNFDGKFLG